MDETGWGLVEGGVCWKFDVQSSMFDVQSCHFLAASLATLNFQH
jgi:hypothetical protein